MEPASHQEEEGALKAGLAIPPDMYEMRPCHSRQRHRGAFIQPYAFCAEVEETEGSTGERQKGQEQDPVAAGEFCSRHGESLRCRMGERTLAGCGHKQ